MNITTKQQPQTPTWSGTVCDQRKHCLIEESCVNAESSLRLQESKYTQSQFKWDKKGEKKTIKVWICWIATSYSCPASPKQSSQPHSCRKFWNRSKKNERIWTERIWCKIHVWYKLIMNNTWLWCSWFLVKSSWFFLPLPEYLIPFLILSQTY